MLLFRKFNKNLPLHKYFLTNIELQIKKKKKNIKNSELF